MGAHTAIGAAAAFGAAVWLGAGLGAVQPAAAPADLAGCLVTERDYARAFGVTRGTTGPIGDGVVLLLASDAGLTARAERPEAYAITGRLESEMAAHAGRRVTISGQPEGEGPSRIGIRPAGREEIQGRPPAGAVGVTPTGSPAHEPGDAEVVPQDPDAAVGPVSAESAATLRSLPRVNVSSYRVLADACGVPAAPRPAEATAPSSGAPGSDAPRQTVAAALPAPPVRVFGCLAPANPIAGEAEGLVLVDAVVSPASGPSPLSGAVPGSSPSGRGSGTVGTTGSAGTVTSSQLQGFRLLGDLGTLAPHVGRRVEVVGTVSSPDPQTQDGASQARGGASSDPTAHPSAAERVLRVSGFRATTNACR